MAMTAQEYLDTFNTLINQGNYDDAARLVKEADLAGYGDEAYRAAAVALDANINLPQETDFISPQGIQSIRDYVNTATAPPPAPVDPNVEKFNSLIREGKFGEAGVLATKSGFTPEQVLPYLNDPNIFPEFGGNVTLDTVKSFVPEDKGIATVDTGSGTGLGASEEFTNAVRGGYFVSAAQIAQNLGYNAQQAAEYINANAAALGLPENFAGVTGENLQSFFDGVNEQPINPGMDDPVEDPGTDFDPGVVTDEDGNIVSGPPDRVISSIPRFARQTQSNVPFAPLRRGLAQLRPAMYMPGLTSGQAPLGGSGFTPESLRTATQGLSPADRAYLMDVGGVSPAEASAAIGTPVGQIQAEYNQLRPKGLFSTGVPAPRGLPLDFVLQTGAYGAPTPTFLALPEKKAATSAAETPLPSAAETPLPSESIQDSDVNPEPTTDREGGLIRMAEGGEPPPMSKLDTLDLGSTFDINDYIKEGILVGGMSKPIRDEYGMIIGYESDESDKLPLPIQRDVVFNEELRGKEAAMGLTDAEREQMMVEMEMRQGRTGISPTTGGLAGIEIGDPMMRRRPQYYSTVEQFRPRYAEGGLANVAQNLANKGRKGDSMLVHMTPNEVNGLQALAQQMGGSLTVNPETGLPEANFFRKLFKAASFVLPFIPIPGLFGMSSLLTRSIFSGIAAGASAKGGFDFKQALGGGLRSYALGSLGEKISPSTPGGASTDPTTTVGKAAGAVDSATVAAPQVAPTGVNPMAGIENIEVPLSGQPALGPSVPIDTYTLRGGPQTGEAFYNKYPSDAVTTTPGSVPEGGAVPGRMANVITPEGEGFGKPLTKGADIAAVGLGGLSVEESARIQRNSGLDAAAVKQREEERRRRFEEAARRTLGRVNVRSGGLMQLAGGGMSYMEAGGTTGPTGAPRDVTGTGDGMSDSVPASIEGVQEARLADGEFVIPADVVADIGNGSSDAGSKKLYDMMDRIRKARHGTTEQPPEIQAERLMPA